MKKWLVGLVVLSAFVGGAAQAGPVLKQTENIPVTRNWGGPGTTQVDSTQFLLSRALAANTAYDTLRTIDLGAINVFANGGPTATKVGVARLWVIFNNATSAGASGDSLGFQFQVSPDGTNWTSPSTAAYVVQTAGAGAAPIPIPLDSDETASASSQVHGARYLRVILIGDASLKQVIKNTFMTYYE